MKILIFNGSPRMKNGNTEKILTHFIKGAREAGAEVEEVYLRQMCLKPCNGCLSCWLRTPGICAINDNIHILREKFLEADVFVLATPIYLFSSTGFMKILMERLFFPLTLPEYLLVEGKVYHPIRFPERKWKCLLITNGAFDGDDVFKPLNDTYDRMIHNVVDDKGSSAFINLGAINIGFGELFADDYIMSKCDPFFDGMKKVGEEMVRHSYICDETLEAVNRPLYQYAGITRQQAIEKNNEMIEEYKAKINFASKLCSIESNKI